MDIVLTLNAHHRQDFLTLLGRAAWGITRPAPTNLDGLADLLRESQVRSIKVQGTWDVDEDVTRRLALVCATEGVRLMLPTPPSQT